MFPYAAANMYYFCLALPSSNPSYLHPNFKAEELQLTKRTYCACASQGSDF